MPIPTFSNFKSNVLRFLENCAVSKGVYDISGWEAGGEALFLGEGSRRHVRPADDRCIIRMTLDERIKTNQWAFASTPGGCESLEGGHSAVETLFLLDELPRLSSENKLAWVEYFNGYQDADTGYFLGPYVPAKDHFSWKDHRACTHPWVHMHDHLIASLCPSLEILGGRPKIPLSQGRLTGRFLDREYLKLFLFGRDWNNYAGDLNFRRHNPWWMGNEYWYPACILWHISRWEAGTPQGHLARQLIDEVWYGWHDRNFSTCGVWIGDLDGEPGKLWRGNLNPGSQPTGWNVPAERYWAAMAIMGGAHQLWFYGFEGHPIPETVRRNQTDAVLAILNRHTGHFGLGDVDNPAERSNNCMDVDCATVLAMNWHCQNYRRADIEAALCRNMKAILSDRLNDHGVLESVPGEPFTHCFNSPWTFSPAGWGNVLNQSFYLWAIIAACSVVGDSDMPELRTFLANNWPQSPCNWLWTPVRQKVKL